MSTDNIVQQSKQNAPDGIGFEKAINVVGDGVTKFRVKLGDIFEGKPKVIKANVTRSRFSNPLDKGLVPLTRELSEIDLCNCITYLINKTQDVKPFKPKEKNKKSGEDNKPDNENPNKPPQTLFERKLSFIQNKAYQVQVIIDDYQTLYSNTIGPDSRAQLLGAISGIQQIFAAGQNSLLNELNDPEIRKVFPQVNVFENFFRNVNRFFDRYTNVPEIPLADVRKVLSYVDKIRAICVAIQGLNSLAALTQLANGIVGGKIAEDIQKLNKIVKPEKLVPLIKNIQKTCLSLQQICKLLISYIQTARTIISVATLLVKIFRIVKKFLLALPLPNMFTTAGITNLFSDITNNKVQDGITQIIKRLNQVNQILLTIVDLISYIVSQIDEVLVYIKIIIANLENCNNVDADTVNDLKQSAKDLEDSKNTLIAFRNNYLNNKNAVNSTYGDRNSKYTIKVIEEQITDRNISIKRRYGIALDKAGYIVAKSTPTFASDTSIIVNEVKIELVSKGLVNPDLSQLSARDIGTINESLNFLESEDISIDDIGNELSLDSLESDKFGLDGAENENNDQENLGLNSFINGIKGGKKLRRKMRKMMAKHLSNTASDLRAVDPNSRTASNLQSQAQNQESRAAQESSVDNKKEINDLNKKKNRLLTEKKILTRLRARQSKIQKIDEEIKAIDAQIQELQK